MECILCNYKTLLHRVWFLVNYVCYPVICNIMYHVHFIHLRNLLSMHHKCKFVCMISFMWFRVKNKSFKGWVCMKSCHFVLLCIKKLSETHWSTIRVRRKLLQSVAQLGNHYIRLGWPSFDHGCPKFSIINVIYNNYNTMHTCRPSALKKWRKILFFLPTDTGWELWNQAPWTPSCSP